MVVVEEIEEETVENSSKCPICKVEAGSRCSACNKVSYCSREHQKAHWKIHKSECVSWKICESPQLGRYLTAVRDIKPGELILIEKPLVIVPPRITLPICLHCYSEFHFDNNEKEDGGSNDHSIRPVSCGKNCGWPMCDSPDCIESRETSEHGAECKFGKDRGGMSIKNFGSEHPTYQAVGLLRVIALKEKDPESFAHLMNLQSNIEERRQKALEARAFQAPTSEPQTGPESSDLWVSVNLIRNFFKLTEFSQDLIETMVGILETNGHEIPLPDNSGRLMRRLVGVYNNASFIEHDCKPNCYKTFGKNNEILIRTGVGIKKGDHLSISYVDPLWGTNDRLNFLQLTKFFSCKCTRCVDKAELGSHISSLRCPHPKCHAYGFDGESKNWKGMISPSDPFDPEADWKCNTCEEDYPPSYAAAIVEKIAKDLEALQPQRGLIDPEEGFLKKISKSLPPYHFFNLELKVELGQLYGRTPEEPLNVLSPAKLLRKRILCEEVLKAVSILIPGLSRVRSLMLYELQAAVCQLSKLRHSLRDISPIAHRDELIECIKMSREVILVLGNEPENSIEFKRADGAKKELPYLRSIIESLEEEEKHEKPQPPPMKIDDDLELF